MSQQRHHHSLLTILLLLLVPLPGYSEIYRSVDAQGNVIFSDKPGKGATAVTLGETNMTPSVAPREQEQTTVSSKPSVPASRIQLTSPTAGQVLPNGRLGLELNASLDQSLSAGQQIRFTHNGETLSTGKSTTYKIPLLQRGPHTIGAQLLDADMEITHQDSASINVYWPQN